MEGKSEQNNKNLPGYLVSKEGKMYEDRGGKRRRERDKRRMN
jgi:hypothetical protein